jgi:hypothetical protein
MKMNTGQIIDTKSGMDTKEKIFGILAVSPSGDNLSQNFSPHGPRRLYTIGKYPSAMLVFYYLSKCNHTISNFNGGHK